MKKAWWAGLWMAVILVSGCRTRDVRTVVVFVPEMKNAACSDIVVRAISRCQGVLPNSIQPDMARRTVTVQYESMVTALKNVEFSVAEAGFKANEVPANAEAAKALPPECR